MNPILKEFMGLDFKKILRETKTSQRAQGDGYDIYVENIVMGKPHGIQMIFANGILQSVCVNNRGNADGPCITYHPNGRPEYVVIYKNDLQEGYCHAFDRDGNEIPGKTFKNGEIV